MKKIGLLVLLLVGLSSFFFWKEEDKKLPPKTATKKTSNVFLSSRSRIKTVTEQTIPDSCESLKFTLDNIDFENPPEDWSAYLIIKDCKKSEYAERIERLKKACSTKAPECFIEALFLRSILRTEGLSEGVNQEELADLILKEFSQKELNFKQLLKHAEAFLELNPAHLPVQKLWATAKALSQKDLKNLPPEVVAEIYEKLNQEAWNDPELKGLDLILKTGLEPHAVAEAAMKALKKDPEDSYQNEILGWSLWQQNKRAEALVYLQKAMELNTKDPWLKEMYKEASSPKAKDDAYKGRISLGIRFEDLFK